MSDTCFFGFCGIPRSKFFASLTIVRVFAVFFHPFDHMDIHTIVTRIVFHDIDPEPQETPGPADASSHGSPTRSPATELTSVHSDLSLSH